MSVLLFLLALGAALCLHGCGDGGSPKTNAKTTVIIMRHCVRSTDENGIVANPSDKFFNNYSSQKWPSYSVPAFQCLPRGEDIVVAQGRSQGAQGGLPLPLRAIADDCQRDNVTMHRFLEGLDIDAKDLTTSVDHTPFAAGDSEACKQVRPNKTEWEKLMDDFIKASPPPPGYEAKMQQLYEILGKGAAGNWTGIPCVPGLTPWNGGADAMPSGACQVASEATERMLMNWGGGLDIAWGKLKDSALPPLMGLHAWQFYTWFACPATYKWQGASMLRDISSRLSVAEPGTTLYVGHDSDIMMAAGALGLSWNAIPYDGISTLPGSMLRFDLEDDMISATYHYVANFSDANLSDGMSTAAAHFSDGTTKTSLKDFQDLVEKHTIADCASTGILTASRNKPTEARLIV